MAEIRRSRGQLAGSGVGRRLPERDGGGEVVQDGGIKESGARQIDNDL